MQAALEVISTRAFHGASMSMIAQQTQVAMVDDLSVFPEQGVPDPRSCAWLYQTGRTAGWRDCRRMLGCDQKL